QLRIATLRDVVSGFQRFSTSFVKCIINTNSLRPTASRESLMDDDIMKQAKKELSVCFKNYLRLLVMTDVEKLSEIIRIHHVFIKALAIEDNELLKLFIDYIPFETNKGYVPFLSLHTYNDVIYYTPSLDDFRQIRRIAGSQGKTVINAAYSFEADLIQKIKIIFPEYRIEKITPKDIIDTLGYVEVSENELYKRFEEKANALLKPFYCKVQLKQFDPIDTPAIYVANDEAMSNKNLQNLSNSSNPFAGTLHSFIKKEEEMPALCFNKDNEIVKNLIQIEDQVMFGAVVHIMYVQALMLGGYPINKKEMTVFNDALYQLLIMGMSDFVGKMDL
ncbi:MAG: HSP90 family protein, partial [Dysgonomonas sp.]